MRQLSRLRHLRSLRAQRSSRSRSRLRQDQSPASAAFFASKRFIRASLRRPAEAWAGGVEWRHEYKCLSTAVVDPTQGSRQRDAIRSLRARIFARTVLPSLLRRLLERKRLALGSASSVRHFQRKLQRLPRHLGDWQQSRRPQTFQILRPKRRRSHRFLGNDQRLIRPNQRQSSGQTASRLPRLRSRRSGFFV